LKGRQGIFWLFIGEKRLDYEKTRMPTDVLKTYEEHWELGFAWQEKIF